MSGDGRCRRSASLVREVLRELLPREVPAAADGVAPDALRELVRGAADVCLVLVRLRPLAPRARRMRAAASRRPRLPPTRPRRAPRHPLVVWRRPSAVTRPGLEVRPVRLATDEELHEFVLQVIALADNPKRRRDLLAGRLRFTLALAGAPEGPADHRIDKGAVTERAVQAAASAGARLILGPRAVLTPLARDRARALGVPIEKER